MIRLSSIYFVLTLISIGWSTALSQVVDLVSFKPVGEDKIVVDYYLDNSKPYQSFDVALFMSNNGGKTFFLARAVVGDVGLVSGRGSKRITWDVFSDVDAFQGEACIAKVVAKEVHSVKEVASNVFFGSEEVKRFVNGTYFHGGWQKSVFLNSLFRPNSGFEIGIKFVTLPLVIEADGFYQTFSPNPGSAPNKEEVKYTGMNLSLGLSLLPVSQYITPSVGLGYQASALYTGSSYGDESTSQVATNAVFWTVAGQINLGAGWSLGSEYKNSIGVGNKRWNQLMVFIGSKL